jgi:RHS repeat-associated protein
VSYTYDSLGRMLSRTHSVDGITKFKWDGWDLVRETAPDDTVTRYFLPGAGGELLSFERGGVVYQVHADALGSVRKVTDDEGDVVFSASYSPWGQTLSVTDNVPGGWPYRFVGALGVRWDEATGLHYMRQRWYDAGLRRFVSRDPLGLSSGANLYTYTNNAPSSLIDPAGLDVAVIYSGPVSTNPYGHVAIAVGNSGVYSYGTTTPAGSKLFTYLADQVQRRKVTVYVLKTTPEQEAKILDYLKKHPESKFPLNTMRGNTCASRSNAALEAAGFYDPYEGTDSMPPRASVPVSTVQTSIAAQAQLPGSYTVTIPRNAVIPQFRGFK